MIKNFIIWVGMAIISLLLIVTLIFAILFTTEFGRSFTASKIMPIIFKIPGYDLEVIDVKSSNISTWSFGKIKLLKAEKKLFAASDFEIEMALSKLLKKQVVIEKIRSDYLELNIYAQDKDNKEENNKGIEKELNPFSVDNIEIASLKIYNHPINKYYHYKVSGNLFFLSKQAPIVVNLDMKSLDNKGLNFKVKTVEIGNKANITGEFFEKSGGMISDLTNNYYQDIGLSWDFNLSRDNNIYSLKINNIQSNHLENPINAKGNLDFNLDRDIEKSWLKSDLKLSGSYNRIPIIMDLKATADTKLIYIQNLNISLEEYGSLSVFGRLRNKDLNFDLKLKDIDTAILEKFNVKLQPAILNTNLKLQGNLDRPEISGSSILRSKLRGENIPKNITLATKIDTKKSMLHIDSSILINEQKKSYFNLASNVKDLRRNIIGLDVKSDIDISYIKYFFDHEDYIAKGILNLDLKINNLNSGISSDGRIGLKNGYLEDEVNGIKLYNIQSNLLANSKQITIQEFSASDADKGQVNAKGMIDWSNRNSKININAKLDNMKFLEREDIDALANGEIDIEGDFNEMLVKGSFNISPLNISLDNLPSSYVSELKVVEIDDYKDLKEKVRKGNAPIIGLDINLAANNQAFLRGRGIDAELKGKINISGYVDNPKYSGVFEIIRGSYTLLEKEFDLTNGRIALEGEEIFLSIKAVYTTNSQEIIANIKGGLDDLKVKFSSVPNMPEDEIISNLLFGKSAQDISPFQAIKLANSIKSIKEGGSSGFNPVDKIREKIGLDSISIDTESDDEDNKGLNIGVGKYIGEKVYLELEKTNDPQTPFRGNVEVEIIPNLNLKTTTGGEVGIEWKRDY